MHVVLVGMMGSGKSTVGRRLATRLDRPFVDADPDLEAHLGRTIAELFETEGEHGFRQAEAAHLERLLARSEPTVVAAGGGVVLREDNRRRLADPAVTVVWLQADPAFLASRAEAKAHRPLLAAGEPARDVFARLDAERRPLYEEVADVVVDVQPFHGRAAASKAALADRIAELVRAHEAARAASEP